MGRLSNYARCLTGNRDTARDLVQSCAVKVLSAKNVPIDEPAYRAWLFKILRNIFLDSLRKKATDQNILRDLTNNSVLEGNNEEELCVYIEQRNIDILSVREGLEKLKASQREILVLIDMAGFSYREVAEMLQVPIGTVMSRLSRSRKALLREINGVNVGPANVSVIGKR
jgi:RNA polymerase sigma-70 factor (ECF subfamily)